jgi:cytochrome c oxidase assembly protein subunit 15
VLLVRRLTKLALGLQMLLVVSGSAVRVTGSGLGCPTWPRCTGGSLANTAALGAHGYIEFGNRLLAVVMEAVGIALVLAIRRVPHPRSWSRLALVQAAIVPLQAVIGGLLVLSGLNPYVLILHFLTSFPLVLGAVALLHLVRDADARGVPEPQAGGQLRWLSGGIVAATSVVLVLGTLVTGTGPHAGDPKVHRLPFDPRDVTQLHADGVYLLTGLVLATATVTWQTPYRRWALALLGLLVTQAGVGYWQYYTGVPAGLVALHVALATTTFTLAAWLLVTAAPSAGPPGRSA